jgi:hypothetical protein
MEKKILIILTALSLLLCAALSADDAANKSSFKLSFSERLRLETWDNTIGFDSSLADENTYTRTRSSLTAEWEPFDSLLLVCKITNEFRYYFAPDDREFTIHEFFFDQLYAKAVNPFGFPGSLTIGRQDMRFGEGFVVMDGGPLDGSRSAYFNGARLDYQISPQNTLSLFYMYQSPTDRMLPVINEQEQKMVEQPEEGYSLYFSGSLGSLRYEPYYIHKNIYETATIKEESSIETLGLRALIPLTGGLEFTGEAASQWGAKGDNDRVAFGGYFHLDYKTGESFPLPELITLGGIYLTGDDPDTAEWEAWDPLFSRWPKWSESLIYAFIKESKVAYWSNFKSLYATIRIQVWSDANLNLTYHFLGADEPAPSGVAFPGGTGTNRGNLFIARLNFKLLPELSGHMVWEHLTPGDFYSAGADGYNWFRTELLLQL